MTTQKGYFSKVREAREALKEKALEVYALQVRIIEEALAAQEFEVAAKANQWLIEHMPADDEGTRMVDPNVDKPKTVEASSGPSIQIGVVLGGSAQKKLPVTKSIGPGTVIDAEANVSDE